MRILFVTPYVPSLIRVRPYQFIRELSRHHEMSVLCSGTSDPTEIDALGQYCKSLDIVPICATDRLHGCAAAAIRGDPLQSVVSLSKAMEQRLHDILARETFDLVHIEHLRAAQLVLGLPPEMPRLFDAVDSISLLLERTLRSSHSFFQRAIALAELGRTRRFEAHTLERFSRTIVTSPEDGAFLQRLAPHADISVVANGVDLDYFRPLPEPREPATLVFSGKMSYHANVTAALYMAREIFPRIVARRPDAQLCIVGSRPPRVVRELARNAAISVVGHVPDMRPYLGRASVAVCPMVIKVGIQNKLLEAMAMAVPTVATPAAVTGVHAAAGREVLIGSTPAGFADQVCRLLDNKQWATQVGRSGHDYVQAHHRWSDAADRVGELHYQAISTGPQPKRDGIRT
jgi:sugar transferase (PEP-CTERM/EpsH1 system associated)